MLQEVIFYWREYVGRRDMLPEGILCIMYLAKGRYLAKGGTQPKEGIQPKQVFSQRRHLAKGGIQPKEVSSQRRYLAKEGIQPKEVSSQRGYQAKGETHQPKSVTLDELQQRFIYIFYFFILFFFDINVQLLCSFIGVRLED